MCQSGNLVINKTDMITALMEKTGNKQAKKKVQIVLKYCERQVKGEVIKDNDGLVDTTRLEMSVNLGESTIHAET